MKVVVAGSRDITDYSEVEQAIADAPFTITEIVSGAARGVDLLGERWAKANGIPVKRFPVTKLQWNALGKKAGYLRNLKMAEYADALIAIWDGSSPGTQHMINIARAQFGGINVHIHKVKR